jgi:PhnB protein
MKVHPYLFFNGQCEEALKFYEQVLGGKIEAMMTHRGTPAANHVQPEWLDTIIHARLAFGGSLIMASDAPPPHYKQPQGFSVNLEIATPAEAERIFNAFAEKGTVTMPFQQTFWAHRFGMLVDRFGIPWMINCEKEI